jgi:hypothetical protein
MSKTPPRRVILPSGKEIPVSWQLRPRVKGEPVDGYCEFEPKGKIVVGTGGYSTSQQAQTLLHEILHLLLNMGEEGEEEIEKLTMLLSMLVQRNKRVFHWIVTNL